VIKKVVNQETNQHHNEFITIHRTISLAACALDDMG